MVADVCKAVSNAYVASQSRTGDTFAVENLLISQLVAVIVRSNSVADSEARVDDCLNRIEILAQATRRVYEAAATGQ